MRSTARPSRRTVAATAAAALLGTGLAVAMPADAAPPSSSSQAVPREGCVSTSDPKGDASAAVGPVPTGGDDDLDLLSMTFRSSESVIAAHLRAVKLAAKPSSSAYSGHSFELGFTFERRAVVLRADKTGPASVTINGAARKVPATAVFDLSTSQVVFELDRAAFAEATGVEILDGMELRSTSARSYAVSPVTRSMADTVSSTKPEQSGWTVGYNACFTKK